MDGLEAGAALTGSGTATASGGAAITASALAVLVFAAFATFLPALSNGFVFDDVLYLTANERIAAGLSAENVRWAFTTTHASNWHPLTWISYLLDVELFGTGPRGHHLVNLALHAASAALLFLILRRATGALWRSLFAVALFAVHPLRVESVAWAAERKDVLSLFLGLLAVAAYLPSGRGRTSPLRHALALACFALGLLAKPTLVSLPFLLLLLDYWPAGGLAAADARGRIRLLLEKTPYVALAAVAGSATLLAQRNAIVALEHAPLGARAANALEAFGAYLLRTAWPAHLSAFYPLPESFSPARLLAAASLLVGFSAAAWALRRRHPALLAGWSWHLIALLPTSGLLQVGSQGAADRYTYLPSVGLSVALVWFAADVLASRRATARLAAGAGAAAVLALASLANLQTRRWRDNETLFRQALAATEGNYLAHHNLAVTLLARGAFDEALPHLEEAVRLRPHFTLARRVLAGELVRRGRLEEAERQYRAVLRQEPANEGARRGLEEVLRRRGGAGPPGYLPPNSR